MLDWATNWIEGNSRSSDNHSAFHSKVQDSTSCTTCSILYKISFVLDDFSQLQTNIFWAHLRCWANLWGLVGWVYWLYFWLLIFSTYDDFIRTWPHCKSRKNCNANALLPKLSQGHTGEHLHFVYEYLEYCKINLNTLIITGYLPSSGDTGL